nr:BAF_HP1_G0046900.mRNA.1.CDS.1 [Saccharomyces cerevisiae]
MVLLENIKLVISIRVLKYSIKSSIQLPELKGRLINSPFHNVLSFLDIIHGNGMPSYSVIVLFIAILKGPSIYRRYRAGKHYRAKRNAVGILGNMEKKKSRLNA